MELEKNVDLYEGFVLPVRDIRKLEANAFEYDAEEECFKGVIEDEDGKNHAYEYYPMMAFWNEVFNDPDDFSGASEVGER